MKSLRGRLTDRRMRASRNGRSSIGQMNARHSTSFRSSHNSRSSSARSYAPSLLHRTRYCGGATLEIGSSCRKPSRRTVSSTFSADPSSSWERTAMRRASATLTSMGFTEFVLHHLPPAPARVLEIGCGDRGGVVPALVDAGYDAIGVDPRAPTGPRYRQADFREVEGAFDAIVAGRVIHHLVPLDDAVERMAELAPLVLVDEFAWDLIDPDLQAWYEAERERRPDAVGPPSLDEWRWKHPGLHPHDAVLAALRAYYNERTLEWVPYFHHWLGDVESPDRIG